MTEETKTCDTCHQRLPLSRFGRLKGKYYRNKCKKCTNAKPVKVCGKCGEIKSKSEYGPRFPHSDRTGVHPWCNDCRAKDTTKVCPNCEQEKPKTEFYVRSRWTGKLHSHCKVCTDKRSIAYAEKHPEKVKKYDRVKDLRSRYGMELDDYETMLMDQSGICKLCGTDDPGRGYLNFSVDHDHDTGEVRGLLCFGCNSALAQFGDNEGGIQQVIEYLNPSRYPKLEITSKLSDYKSGTPEYNRNKQCLKLYGIGIREFNHMMALQIGVCAICGTDEPKGRGTFCIDHDHETKEVRGGLCYPCNAALGALGDTIDELELVLEYVRQRVKEL